MAEALFNSTTDPTNKQTLMLPLNMHDFLFEYNYGMKYGLTNEADF